MRAGIYVRISRDHTGEQLGVQRQQEDCRELAASLGWEVAETYVENDMSALKARPAYQRMLEDLAAGRISAILAWHPDRLYRRVTDLQSLVEACKQANAQVATVNAGHIDLSTPTGRLVAGLLAQVAMYEVEHKSERWSRSWRQAREAGKPPTTGSRMFGYTRDSEVIEEEAAICRRMAVDVLAGVPLLTVCRWLEAEGVLTTRGTSWTTANLKQYLTNPRLAGWSHMKREIVAEGTWTPILDRETFEAVGTLLRSRQRSFVPRKALLNGLIHCGACGHRLITSGKNGQRTYRCPNRPGMRGCGQCSVNAEPVERIVEAYAKERAKDPELRARVLQMNSLTVDHAAEIARLDERILELEQQLDDPDAGAAAAITRAIGRAQDRIEQLRAAAIPVPAPALPNRGEWPEDLRRRVDLVQYAVARVDITRPTKPSRLGFDKERVKISPR